MSGDSGDPEQVAGRVQRTFEELLGAHDVPTRRYADWVVCGDGFPGFRASFEPGAVEQPAGTMSFQVMLDEGVLVEECFAALGDDPIGDAFMQFSATMLHPILAACGYEMPDGQVSRGASHGIAYVVGNMSYRFSEGCQADAPEGWFNALCSAYAEETDRRPLEWVSAYYGRLRDAPPFHQVARNNVEWPSGTAATVRLDWPSRDGFYGARLFSIFRSV